MSPSFVPPASAIVLAGGRASRFGRDKLAEQVQERPLIHYSILALASVATEVLVVASSDGPEPSLPAELTVPARIVRDTEAFGGPLAGLLAGLERASESLVLVVGGDMPQLRPELLAVLLRRLEAGPFDAVALAYRGRVEPLPCAVRNGAALQEAQHLLGRGERSLLSLLRALRARPIVEQEWRPLDPTAATLLDVDRPEDLPARIR